MLDTTFDALPTDGALRRHAMERSGEGQAGSGRAGSGGARTVGFRPLYRQVYDTLLKRLADAVWQPGQILPSEGQLAVELGVSQGTVRKALDALTADSLLVRRQGRGTFVADHDDKQSVFRFLKLRPDGDGTGMPTSRVTGIAEATASADERGRLDLVRSARVVRIERVRAVDAKLCVVETISVPAGLFPGIAQLELPNTLYSLYAARYGITIATANERLKAVAIGSREAALLQVPAGTPALEIDRVAIDLEERPVEWRLSTCLTQDIHYLSVLR
ncbi:GntR family transcriptional regulator [Methylobacterium phyllosphaerae]